jgi:predicted PurR-regulated permease PerM
MAIWETALVLLILSLTILFILLIPIVFQFKYTLKKMDQTFDTLNADLPELLSDLRDVGASFSNVSQTLENITDDVAELEQTVVTEIKEPLQNVASFIGSVLQFGNRLRRKKKSA